MNVGARVRNIDWESTTTGRARFVDDRTLPGTLQAGVLRSPHAHARIVSVDLTAARAVAGVAVCLTADDLPDTRYPHMGPRFADRSVLARDVVRFAGEPVVLVAAETGEQVHEALRRIEIRYKILRSATTMAEALAPRAPRIHHRELGRNIAARFRRTFGAMDTAGAEDLIRVAGRYRFGRQTHACMEPSATLARWHDRERRLELWTTTQSPYFVRDEVAHVLGLDLDQVVIRESAVGGGFGARSKVCEHEALAGALSMAAGRPVRLVLGRDEEFATTKCRHDFEIDLATTATPEGDLINHEAVMRVDNGAYNHSGPSVVDAAIADIASLYPSRGVTADAILVDTNKHPGGQFRGYGGLQATFALESQIDELATELAIDPLDLRLRNCHRSGDTTLAGWRLTTAQLAECLDAVRTRWGWDDKRRKGGTGRGVGLAVAVHQTGIRSYPDANRAEADVIVGADGGVTVRFGSADPGTGQRTVIAQFAADELGVPLDRVAVEMMDSERTPFDLGSWSSRGTFMAGHAVTEAAREAAARLRAAAAEKFGVAPEEIDLADGEAAHGADRVGIGELAALSGEIAARSNFVVGTDMVNRETGIANLSPSYSFAAQAVEVEVDRATGQVTVLDVFSAHDSGRVINPVNAESQVTGGVVMGLGAALGEELIYEHGRLVNASYLNYGLPRSPDAPEVEVVFVGEGDAMGPAGAKSLGEIPMMGIPAAVANAVEHAVGVRITELPVTPDKVLAALRARQGAAPRRHHVWRRPERWWVALVRTAYPLGLHWLLHRVGTRFSRRNPGAIRPPAMIEPATVEEAAGELARDPDAAVLGGGTDLLPARDQGVAGTSAFIDIRSLTGLGRVARSSDGGVSIGACATLSGLASAPAARAFPVLRQTIETIATAPIREMATVAGNLAQEKRCWFYRSGFDCYKRGGASCPCYAVEGDSRFYHAVVDAHRCQAVTPSDLATTLAALDSTIEIAGASGARRKVSIAGLYSGPGELALAPGELITGVEVPGASARRVSRFDKVQLWHGDFAVAAVCASLLFENGEPGGRVLNARVVLGSLAPVPWRAYGVEKALVGEVLTAERIERAAEAWTAEAHPLRRNAWKVDAGVGVVIRCLTSLAARNS